MLGVHQTVDLLSDKPNLSSIADDSGVTVTIDSVQYAVTANTLNIATPPMTVYVAPMSVTDPDDPSAQAVGTIAPVAAMATLTATDMPFTANGQAALKSEMSDFKIPFNIIVGATIVVGRWRPDSDRQARRERPDQRARVALDFACLEACRYAHMSRQVRASPRCRRWHVRCSSRQSP